MQYLVIRMKPMLGNLNSILAYLFAIIGIHTNYAWKYKTHPILFISDLYLFISM